MTAVSPRAELPVAAADGTGGLSPEDQQRVIDAVRASKSEATQRAYLNDWTRFLTWCEQEGRCALPATTSTLAKYITKHADVEDEKRPYAISTIKRWVASINYVHRAHGAPAPGEATVIRDTLSGLSRLYARDHPRPPRRRAALLLDPLRDIVTTARDDATTWRQRIRERRDTAILLLGWAAAMRRSEITALTIGNLSANAPRHTPEDAAHDHWEVDGLNAFVSFSKSDQTGVGMTKILPTGTELASCAPCAIVRWLHVLDVWETDGRVGLMREFGYRDRMVHHVCHGPDFGAHTSRLDPQAPLFRAIRRSGLIADTAADSVLVHRVIRARAAAAGCTANIDDLGGHSLRAGFITEGFARGATTHELKNQTGHVSDVVLAGYARHLTAWDANAANTIGM